MALVFGSLNNKMEDLRAPLNCESWCAIPANQSAFQANWLQGTICTLFKILPVWFIALNSWTMALLHS